MYGYNYGEHLVRDAGREDMPSLATSEDINQVWDPEGTIKMVGVQPPVSVPYPMPSGMHRYDTPLIKWGIIGLVAYAGYKMFFVKKRRRRSYSPKTSYSRFRR